VGANHPHIKGEGELCTTTTRREQEDKRKKGPTDVLSTEKNLWSAQTYTKSRENPATVLKKTGQTKGQVESETVPVF